MNVNDAYSEDRSDSVVIDASMSYRYSTSSRNGAVLPHSSLLKSTVNQRQNDLVAYLQLSLRRMSTLLRT